MTTFLQGVEALIEATRAERLREKQSIDAARAASWRDTMRPLKDRLADLLSTIPDEVRATGLSLSALQMQLRGRTASKAHCGEVATALRQLGYRRVRVWKQTDTDGFNALWKTK
jgi:Tfp pilus assembly protein PilN